MSCRPVAKPNWNSRVRFPGRLLFAFSIGRLLDRSMLSDGELLRRYLNDGSQAAFTTVVERHINIVYRSALRRVGGNAHAADDVTQRVFTALARKAGSLLSCGSVAGWLYTSTRFAAAEVVRAEQRRRRHEQEAHTMNELNSPETSPVRELEAFVDEVLEQLPERDRDAVLLHFFEGRTFAETAEVLSTSADAARMRVNRALERMRSEMARRGIASTAAAFSTFLATQSMGAASAPTASSVAAVAMADSAAAGGAVASVFANIAPVVRSSTFFKTFSAALVVGLGLSGIIYFNSDNDTPEIEGFVNAPASVSENPTGADSAHIQVETAEAPPKVSSGLQTQPVSASVVTNVAAATAASRAPSTLDMLSDAERNIITVLWRQFDPGNPQRRAIVAIGNGAPNSAGVDGLLARGLVAGAPAPNPKRRLVFLTNAGIAFCRRNRTAIEAHIPAGNWRKVAR